MGDLLKFKFKKEKLPVRKEFYSKKKYLSLKEKLSLKKFQFLTKL